MGLLEWLGLRKEQPKQPQQPSGPSPSEEIKKEVVSAQAPLPRFQKPAEWKLPREDWKFLSDSEKLNYVLQGVYSIYDELKPMADDGSRVSRLQLLLENLTPAERESVKSKIEELDIDNAIVKFLDFPKSIEEISAQIRKSYGYAAARLRHLRATGRVARLRDPRSNKYKYTRVSGTRTPDLSTTQVTLPSEPERVDVEAEPEKAEEEEKAPAAESKPETQSPESPV